MHCWPNKRSPRKGKDKRTHDKILVTAFTNGIWKGKFLFSLYKNNPKTMSDVLYRAIKYMNVEDALLA